MSTTTVKVSSSASRKLETLQARALLRTGKRLTKQTIIEELVDRALEEDEPLILLKAPKYPLPRKARELLLAAPVDWGVETREEDIDRILYGESR